MNASLTIPPRDALLAVRTVLLESPAAIESLPQAHASALDRLFEANALEPELFDRARRDGVDDRIQPSRLSAWRLARLMAVARMQAYQDAFEEVVEAACALGAPLRLLPGPQMAFEVYAKPEHRPLASLDLLVPPGREREIQAALRKRRFFELEDLSNGASHARPLERDGVVVKLFRRSAECLRPAPWEAAVLDEPAGPVTGWDPAALVVLLCDEAAARRYARCLRILRDLHEVATRLSPDWSRVVRLAQGGERTLEVSTTLAVLSDVLGTPVPREAIEALAPYGAIGGPRLKSLIKVARAASLSAPATARQVELLSRLLGGAVREEPALSAS